jgi:hypothetical protein
MGFEGSQYVVYRHSDRDHDHIHIVASRIRITDGSTVSDSWDYPRSEKVIRALEKQYQLTPTPSSKEREDRAPTTGEMRRLWRTGEAGIREQLVEQIEQATTGQPTLPEFMERLKDNGVDVRVSYTRTDKVKGISYELAGVAFSGTKLGRAYTFPGLQTHRGVTYSPEMQGAIEAANQRQPLTEDEHWQQQQERTAIVAPLLYRVLELAAETQYQGRNYAIHWDGELTLTRQSDGQTLMRAVWNDDRERWEQSAPARLQRQDVEETQAALQRLEQIQRAQIAGVIVDGLLKRTGQNQHQGQRYEARREDDHLVLIRRADQQRLMTARWNEAHQVWEQVEPSHLQDVDMAQLKQLAQQLWPNQRTTPAPDPQASARPQLEP